MGWPFRELQTQGGPLNLLLAVRNEVLKTKRSNRVIYLVSLGSYHCQRKNEKQDKENVGGSFD